ncbi:MAG TPA: signal recognition particle protein [Sphingobacterium bovisgrunnientis]|jgi:signal recognition particle subunit SRP54|uniref:signal recognition particle protein n=1 Tax=Sphingobacterium bovisgrunnientis TaxID=1874697 RepID=UPI001359D6D7|nr:signal recognition particle protein [Sphingobacterium bovisgrunnientis]HLS37055.1 signal recognition particle protein [Sphingobacterium bovisgrunnientis]
MFSNLQDKLDRAFKVLKGQGNITEINVAETMKEIRKALLDADVNYKTAKTFTDDVKQKALGENVLTSISPGQLLTKIMNDELTALMGGTVTDLDLSKNPTVILIAGLNGAGKTTFTGKLANYLKTTKGKKPLLVAGDVYRPAAIDQLEVLGGQVGVPVYTDRNSTDPIAIAKAGVEEGKRNGNNVIIIDTAGRLAIDEALMNEITAVKEATQPQEILFVVDSMTGQDAVNTAKTFNDRLDFTGVVLTKLDGDTRGGAALSIKSVVNKPIKFIGTGEKMEALDVFYPDRMASRILGMGDVVSLVERAQQQFDEKQAAELQKKIRKNKFDFNDFRSQIQQIKKMGNMKDLIGMIPGAGKALKDVEIEDDAFKPIEAIIDSMTPFERENPDAIDQRRRTRIAKGSGTNIDEVNKLLKQFMDMRKVMKQMSNPAMAAKMMRNMPKMPGKPF